MRVPFLDRYDAGRQLAEKLRAYGGRPEVIVLALPRGGIPVGYEVARALGAPLDVFLVRKLGLPGHEELAMGAIASGGIEVLNEDVVSSFGISREVIAEVAAREGRELARREALYRGAGAAADVQDRLVILIDDGLATGATMRAAVAALRERSPKKIVIAVPTAAPDACAALAEEVDAIVCGVTPEPFYGVGFWYRDFSQTTDEEVIDLLRRAKQR